MRKVTIFLLLLGLFFLHGCKEEKVMKNVDKGSQNKSTVKKADQSDSGLYGSQRKQMVEKQIKDRGIEDKDVLNSMLSVPRHKFIPESYREMAYSDHPVSIGYDQTISQPYIVALMTELLDLKPKDCVLEIGTGSGYQAAVLSEIVDEVYTIEIIPELAKRAEKALKMLDYKNVKVKIGDGFLGWPKHAPFDAIIVTCAPPEIPPPLMKQLNEGGRLVIPIGKQWSPQKLIKATKKDGKIKRELVSWVRFVPMTGGGVKAFNQKLNQGEKENE